MISAAAAPAQKRDVRRRIAPFPALRAMLGQDLALWDGNPGAPVRFFVLDGAALALYGENAWLCGSPVSPEAWEELRDFLRFVGVRRLRCTAAAPAGWQEETSLCCCALPQKRPLPLATPPAGTRLDRQPPVGEVADFLFAEDRTRRDDFYAATCPALARGLARLWALRGPAGEMLSTVGAYALWEGEAYMAMGQTLAGQRGRGLGGWLIPALANELAAEGWQPTFLCKPKRRRFYERLGFLCKGEYKQYIL